MGKPDDTVEETLDEFYDRQRKESERQGYPFANITRRDWLAGLAMQGLLSDSRRIGILLEMIQTSAEKEELDPLKDKNMLVLAEVVSLDSYKIADALIAVGKKP